MQDEIDEQRIGNLPVHGELAFPKDIIEPQRGGF
jgi:hypothetical protein